MVISTRDGMAGEADNAGAEQDNRRAECDCKDDGCHESALVLAAKTAAQTNLDGDAT